MSIPTKYKLEYFEHLPRLRTLVLTNTDNKNEQKFIGMSKEKIWDEAKGWIYQYGTDAIVYNVDTKKSLFIKWEK